MSELLIDLVKQYQNLGWYLVPLQEGQKKPIILDWNLKENCIAPDQLFPSEIEVATKDQGKIIVKVGGVGLAHAYSNTCTVDLDDLNLARHWFGLKGVDIDAMIEDKNNVLCHSGMPNRGKLLFKLPPNSPPLQHVKRDADGFELRCSTSKGTTVQDAIPPSMHPKMGKPYFWQGDFANAPYLPPELNQIWQEFIDKRKNHKPIANAKELLPYIESAMEVLDPDMDYNSWLAVGMALHSVGNQAFDIWNDWSQQGKSYIFGDCDGRWLGFDQGGGITVGSLFKLAKDAGWSPKDSLMNVVLNWQESKEKLVLKVAELAYRLVLGPIDSEEIMKKIKTVTGLTMKVIMMVWMQTQKRLMKEEPVDASTNNSLTHEEISEAFYETLAKKYPPEGISSRGMLWCYEEQHWSGVDDKNISKQISRQFNTQDLCKVQSQYAQIAKHVLNSHVQLEFFDKVPVGIATQSGFYTITENGEIKREHNSPKHKQRWIIPREPTKGKMPLFMSVLENAMGNDPEQIPMFQMAIGAILFNLITTRYQKAVILYGKSDTGKSIIIDVICEMFPVESVTHISPDKFSSDYNKATLANSALNTFEELPDNKSISSPEFKILTSGGKIDARPIYAAPFSFVAKTSHLFSSNHLPTTNEVNDAFFKRWLMFDCNNPVPKKDQDMELTEKIIENELGSILYWGIEGMKKLLEARMFPLSNSHISLMENWTKTSNVVLEFLHDPEWIIHGKDKYCKRSELYRIFREWSRYHERKMINKTTFNNRIKDAMKVDKPETRDGHMIWKEFGIVVDHPSMYE